MRAETAASGMVSASGMVEKRRRILSRQAGVRKGQKTCRKGPAQMVATNIWAGWFPRPVMRTSSGRGSPTNEASCQTSGVRWTDLAVGQVLLFV